VTVDLVRAGRHPGASGYVNAVLRRVSEADLDTWIHRLAPDRADDEIGHLAVATSHPRWIAAALSDALAPRRDELEAALRADDAPPAVHLVARPGRIDRDDLVVDVDGEPARYSPYGVYLPAGHPGSIAAVADGRAAVQDEGSQLVAIALATAEVAGDDTRWLDLAAGPGGKAGLLGALAAERGGTLDAVEVSKHRANLVRRTTSGLPVTVHVADGRDPGLESAGFDRVLLDAPCTGLGALRRRPEARWRRDPSDVADLVRLQGELLASAARLVRPGGLIGYVTCSPHLSETAGIVARRPSDLELIDARPYLPGVPDLGDGPTVQLWPHRHGTDAMFLALLRRS
jgi:16S rRNA (cytosine967-C5)-methyltransferase